MISFENDYSEGAHPKILEKLGETNFIQTTGYGLDEYSAAAKEKIKKACGQADIDIHFIAGGTLSNLIIISSVLRAHEGVISAKSGHIAQSETGAIEATGHKVLELSSEDGKIYAKDIENYLCAHRENPGREHSVKPGMVYISHPTETGTLYTKEELVAIRKVCDDFSIPLFLDGARLGYGLVAAADLTLEDITNLTDIYYIGGTKCGALFGEAIVITKDTLKEDFRYIIKQKGGLFAKGRILGLQFETLFTDNLYTDICEQAINFALEIKAAFQKNGKKLFGDSYTNQQFVILPFEDIKKLSKKYVFENWAPFDESHDVVRFCTSWATRKDHIKALIVDIENL